MAEKQYIERDRIVKFIEDGLNDPDKTKAFGHDAVEILAEIHLAPAADVAPVVRCKDCKYWEHEEDVDFICKKHFGYRTSLDFCSYGERKEATP